MRIWGSISFRIWTCGTMSSVARSRWSRSQQGSASASPCCRSRSGFGVFSVAQSLPLGCAVRATFPSPSGVVPLSAGDVTGEGIPDVHVQLDEACSSYFGDGTGNLIAGPRLLRDALPRRRLVRAGMEQARSLGPQPAPEGLAHREGRARGARRRIGGLDRGQRFRRIPCIAGGRCS